MHCCVVDCPLGTPQNHKTNNNAAIISLLNSAPAAMTSSAVVNSLNTPSNSPVTIPIQRLIATQTNNTGDNLQQSQQVMSHAFHIHMHSTILVASVDLHKTLICISFQNRQ